MSESVENQAGAAEATPEKAARVPHRKERRGVVVSAKMQKTIIVRVERRVKHKTYKKYVRVWKRFSVHDEIGCNEGDLVLIQETRPMSKNKRWKVVRQLGKDA
ncbi:MAG: 30S ribosomal protein S17 [Myxococcota bacterium]